MGKINRKAKRLYKSPAVAAEIWRPREGKDRPTEERRRRSVFALRDTEDAGVTVAVDLEATLLDRLQQRGVISADQCQGGLDFAALMARTRLGAAPRSCLDWGPLGYDSGEVSAAELRDAEDKAELYLACGSLTWAELRRVCVEGALPKDLGRLRQGLDLCARFWGLRPAKK